MRTIALVIALLALGSAPAYAADPARTPTPKDLWNAYPLQPEDARTLPSPTATPARTATPSPTRQAADRSRRRTEDTRSLSLATWIVLAFPVVFLTGLGLAQLRRPRPVSMALVASTPPPPPPPTPPPTAPRRFGARSYPDQARPAPPAPPPPPPVPSGAALAGAVALLTRDAPWPEGSERAWRCEIVWRSPEFRARLFAPGTRASGSPRTPGEPTAELQEALEELGSTLELEGWTAVEPGERWFGRRYVWTRPEPPPGTEGAAA